MWICNEFLVPMVDPDDIAFVDDTEIVRDDLITSRINGCTTINNDVKSSPDEALQCDHSLNRITF
mgnify:CR=1 FL=1